ncbi:Rieske 2Fe-2S domain-containing protein [Flocculibacter collagenilyticus]|uniref:Rieske 2Fe-2S domain-containing protein n=1 Tax=Flocculibacter collagenilyticus TaxID=2744479 RepID=UPI0018F6811B|nr:Rieske 2Fe-2S domain-containing protein [Flocculibacter collagenilyticus]
MSQYPILINDFRSAPKRDGADKVWLGKAQLPGGQAPVDLMIFERDGEMRTISAYCPHQGFELCDEPLDSDGVIWCPLHALAIPVFGKRNRSYLVNEIDGKYYIVED